MPKLQTIIEDSIMTHRPIWYLVSVIAITISCIVIPNFRIHAGCNSDTSNGNDIVTCSGNNVPPPAVSGNTSSVTNTGDTGSNSLVAVGNTATTNNTGSTDSMVSVGSSSATVNNSGTAANLVAVGGNATVNNSGTAGDVVA